MAMMKSRINVLVLVLLSSVLLSMTTAKQKPINIALSGKWKSTPLLLEASEFFAKESNDLFWRFVDHVADQGHDYFELASDEVKYMFLQKYASEVLSPLQFSFLKFSLSLRTMSPTIQMFQQLAEQIPSTTMCSSFIEVNGEFSCDSNGLSELLTTSISRRPTPVYKFDHIYPGKSGQKSTVVILYTQLGSNTFKEFHPALAQLAKMGEITYCIRHFIKEVNPNPIRLSGYGVELAIKSTEYKAKDDTKVDDGHGESSDEDDEGEEVDGIVFSKLRELHPDLKNELKELKNYLMDSATELTPFKVWQLQDLGYQAAQKIVSAAPSESLQYLRDISQNFPTQARSLVRTAVTSEFRREVKKNQQAFEGMGVMPGSSSLYLNGLSVDLDTYDIFTLLDVMTSEAGLVEGLHSLGYKGDRLQKLLQLDLKDGNEQSYAVDIRHSAVQYLNDLSKDKTYRSWPGSVQDLLRPTFPGMLRHVAKNLFHLIFIVDPASPESKGLLKMAEAFLVHKAPLRLGLVFVCNTESKKATGFDRPNVALARAYNFILIDQGSAANGLSFITDVFQKIGTKELTSEAIIAEFISQYPGEDKQLVFGDNDDYDDVRKAGVDFVSRIGLSGQPQVLVNGVPLDREQVKMDNFEESVVMEVLKQTQVIQTAVYKGKVSDRTDILDWWMERDNVLPRLNSRFLTPDVQRLDLTGSFGQEIRMTPSIASHVDSKALTAYMAENMKYITKRDEKSTRPVTVWVVADLETEEGRDMVSTALRHVKTSNSIRMGVIANPSDTSPKKNLINRAVRLAMDTLSMPHAKSLVMKLTKEEYINELKEGTKTIRDLEVHGMDMDAYMKALNAEDDVLLKIQQTYAGRVLSLGPGDRALVANGAIIGPLDKEEELAIEDFNLMEKVAITQGAVKVQAALENILRIQDKEKDSDAVMKVSSLLLSKGKQDKRQKVEFESDNHSVIKIGADTKVPAFTIEAVVNPVSTQAQKLSAILMVLKEIANTDIRIYLNPLDKLSEMPLKSFYRYVLEPEVTFDSEGTMSEGPSARFLDMPQKSLLTLKMDTPESWLVEAVTSPYDLDNILLEEVERSVAADFELEYLLLEGHCHDASTMQPPRGLQFVLGTNSSVALVDTIVMANLGYFQLKANPGLWQLRLREGRSNEIFTIDSHEFTDTPDNVEEVIIAINSFKSKTIRVKVSKKADKADQSLLQDDAEDSGGLWDSISNTFTGSTKTEDDKDSTLNIFSVASGHLYERFLRIMMLSVLKNTQSKVKFWFLKNFLSPSFKDFIPYMAQEYGFEYELVQYKWPHWLNQQKEKQRIIWGYKILFLDVLFPLDVKKIIFVDADQIVRADLQELHDLDLNGAPYGYTPFCDSRKEMDGFRFWKSGYWNSHLAGRKYHISALYVVDLKRFRRIAAGDRLRGQYQGLSQDPNSLANLDQDLPNNMIHQVSIKSLPQEWLYCETWCSESTKPQAKTIDLCNNPLTKEPKLKAAMRIVPEWKNYDYEIKVLWDEIYDTNTKSQIEYDPPDISSKSDKKTKAKEEL